MTTLPSGIESCPVADEISADFPGIGLLTCVVATSKTSSAGVVEELDLLAQRLNGPKAVHVATEPVAAAYRALRAGLGLDPDSGEASVEAIVRRRLIEGGYRSSGQPNDAITITTLETGVPIQAFASHDGRWSLGIDPVTNAVALLCGGEMAAPVFGDPSASYEYDRGSPSSRLLAVVAPGVMPELVGLALDRTRDLSKS